MKFIVKESEWYRGKHGSKLLREDGKKCCIGFVAQQCGIADHAILNRSAIHMNPGDVLTGVPEWMKYEGWLENDISLAYGANDDSLLTDDQRKAKLQAIFARNGDELEFVP